MNAVKIFTTKDHILSKEELFPALPVTSAETLTVSKNFSNGFMGFGVAITSSSCYELNLMNPEERKALLSHLYGKDGIGLSIGRVCVGSCDYSPEIYSYDDVANDTSLEHFSVARDERYVIPMIKEILEINPDLYLFASPWSPPYWMKTGNNMCGGYMRDCYVDCYADYIVKFIEAYASYGIKISALTPQNECNTQSGGSMPSCIWHPETEAAFIKTLRKKLDDKGLDVKIWMYDHNFNDVERVIWSLDNCEGLKDACDGVAFHYYRGAIEETCIMAEKYPDIECHFTEGGPRISENYDIDWCKWGLMAVKALKMGFKSMTGWNLMLDEFGGPNVGPFGGICGGLITRDSRSGELSYSGQYRAFAHLSPYINKNSKIYPLMLGASFNMQISDYPKHNIPMEGVLVDNGDKKIAIIVNPNARRIQTQLNVDGCQWYTELHPESVSTLIFS